MGFGKCLCVRFQHYKETGLVVIWKTMVWPYKFAYLLSEKSTRRSTQFIYLSYGGKFETWQFRKRVCEWNKQVHANARTSKLPARPPAHPDVQNHLCIFITYKSIRPTLGAKLASKMNRSKCKWVNGWTCKCIHRTATCAVTCMLTCSVTSALSRFTRSLVQPPCAYCICVPPGLHLGNSAGVFWKKNNFKNTVRVLLNYLLICSLIHRKNPCAQNISVLSGLGSPYMTFTNVFSIAYPSFQTVEAVPQKGFNNPTKFA